MKVVIEIDEIELRKIVLTHMRNSLGEDVIVKEEDVRIEVKSKQNYKAEWEEAAFRARLEKHT